MLANIAEEADPLLHDAGPTFVVGDDMGPIIDLEPNTPTTRLS